MAFFVRVLFRRSTSWNKIWTEIPGAQKSGAPACSVYCELWRVIFVHSQNETWFHLTILARRIVRRRLDFWKICRPLDYTVGLPRNSRLFAKAVQKFSDSAYDFVLRCSKLRSIQLYKKYFVLFYNIIVRILACEDVTIVEFTVCFVTLGRTVLRFFSNVFGGSQTLRYVFHYSWIKVSRLQLWPFYFDLCLVAEIYGLPLGFLGQEGGAMFLFCITLVNNQLDAQFFIYVYFYSLHVSGSHVPIIRRIIVSMRHRVT